MPPRSWPRAARCSPTAASSSAASARRATPSPTTCGGRPSKRRGSGSSRPSLPAALVHSLVRRWVDGSRVLTAEEAGQVILGLGLKSARDEAATLLLDTDGEVLLALLTALARHAHLADAAPICTVLAWVAYAHG